MKKDSGPNFTGEIFLKVSLREAYVQALLEQKKVLATPTLLANELFECV